MNKEHKHSHRQLELIEMLHRLGGSARSTDLAKALDVSEETVRRTIKALSKTGVLERMYGGAYLVGQRDAPGFFQRIAKHSTEKQAIATVVLDRVQDGMTLFLDVGSTTAFVAEKLRDRFNLTVATNSIGVAQVLANHNGNKVHFMGGEMQSDERGTFGFVTEQHARRFVYHNQVIIFIDHIQRNVLWQDVTFFGLWHVDFNISAHKNLGLRIKNDNSVHFDRAIRDQTG